MRKHVGLCTVLVFLFNNAAVSQPRVTFEDNYFIVNNDFFFPIGWYGTKGSSDLSAINGYGANVVLQYWTGVIDCYRPGGDCLPSQTINYNDPANYIAAIVNFLNAAAANNLMVILHLPTMNIAGIDTMPSTFIEAVVSEHDINSHSALLAWYQADEPEFADSAIVSLSFLRNRYETIRGEDPDHPVLVVFANSLEFGTRFPAVSGNKFYDVLMADGYTIRKGDPVPSPGLKSLTFQATMLDSLYGVHPQNDSTSGSMMFVAQGYGESNVSGIKNIFPLFKDDFADGNANGWVPIAGTWSVMSGMYSQTSGLSNTNASRKVGQSSWWGMLYYNWDITFPATNTDVPSPKVGLHLLVSDSNATERGNSYLIWQESNGIKIIESVNNASFERASFTGFPVSIGNTYNYEVEYYFPRGTPQDGQVKVWRNGVFVGSWTDTNSPLESGDYVSLRTNNTEAHFDNIIVSNLKRNPTISEIAYSCMSPIYFAENRDGWPGKLGGVLYWDYDFADQSLRDSIGNFIQYFTTNNFGDIFRQNSVDTLVDSLAWPLVHRLRKYGDDHFLLVMNRDTLAAVDRTIQLNDLGNTYSCVDFREPLSGNIWKGLSAISGGDGDYQFVDSFGRYEVNIYKIHPGLEEVVFGLNNGTIFKNYSGRWGDNHQITNTPLLKSNPFPPVEVTEIAKYEKGDGDSNDEVIIAFADGKVFHQGSGGSNDAYKFLDRSGFVPTAVVGADLDGDGADELVVGFSDGKLYQSNGVWGGEDQITDPDFPSNVAITDIAVFEDETLQGNQGLIVAFADGKVFKQQSENDGDAHKFIQRNGTSANAVAGADLSGDGEDEFIVGFSDGKLYRGTGVWGENAQITDSDFPANTAISKIAVFEKDDGDNAKELLVVFGSGKVCMQSSALSNNAQTYVDRGISVNSVAGVDLDGYNGADDIVVGFSNGEISADANAVWDVHDIFRNGATVPTAIVGANLQGYIAQTGLVAEKGAERSTPSKQQSIETTLPRELSLLQNYPNPFNPTTIIRFDLPESGPIALKLYDILGRKVLTILEREMKAGYHSVEFEASGFSSGMYFYRLETTQGVMTRKMCLLK